MLGRLLLPLLLLLAAPAQALELRVLAGRTAAETAVIYAEGRILPDDPDRFRAILRPRQGQRTVLVMHSPGGSVAAAIEMAEIIARLKITVAVPKGGVCASACFLMFAAAPERVASDTARLGVHSASHNHFETASAMAATTVLARELHRYGVPEQIVGAMVTTRAAQIFWLDEAQRRSMSVASWEALAAPPAGAPRPQPWLGLALPTLAAVPEVATVATGQARGLLPAGLSPIDVIAAGEPLAFREGLTTRTRWEEWTVSLSRDARLGAEYWAAKRDLANPGDCRVGSQAAEPPASRYHLLARTPETLQLADRLAPPGSEAIAVNAEEFQSGCATARQRLTTIDMRRRSEVDFRRGWTAYLPTAYREDILESIATCRVSGGRAQRNGNFETVRDINGDGRPDYLLDLSALRCQRRNFPSISDHCGTGGCTLRIYVSTATGGYAKGQSITTHRWTVKDEGTTATLLLFPRDCADEACAQRYVWTGDKLAARAN